MAEGCGGYKLRCEDCWREWQKIIREGEETRARGGNAELHGWHGMAFNLCGQEL